MTLLTDNETASRYFKKVGKSSHDIYPRCPLCAGIAIASAIAVAALIVAWVLRITT